MTKRKIIPAKHLIAKWRKDPVFKREYQALEDEFALAATMIAARGQAGLTQQQLARKMATTRAVIARWESGRVKPSTRTLEKRAVATATRLRITLERPRGASAKLLHRAA